MIENKNWTPLGIGRKKGMKTKRWWKRYPKQSAPPVEYTPCKRKGDAA